MLIPTGAPLHSTLHTFLHDVTYSDTVGGSVAFTSVSKTNEEGELPVVSEGGCKITLALN